MNVDWIRNEAGVAVLADMGIHVTDGVVRMDTINWKASAENRARKNPLDESRLEHIASAYARGIPMPMIFIRRDTRRGNTIADGNHRANPLRGKVKDIRAHIFECTDAEFEMACKLFNTVVGEGMSREERIDAAIDASLRSGASRKAACKMFGISEQSVIEAMKTREIEAKLEALPSKKRAGCTPTHVRALGDLAKNENVFRAAVEAISATKIPARDVHQLAKEAREQKTEAGQVSVFERFAKIAEVDREKVVPRNQRKAFLSACTQLKNLKEKGLTTWEGLEFTSTEIAEAKELAIEVMDMLNCLCKANG